MFTKGKALKERGMSKPNTFLKKLPRLNNEDSSILHMQKNARSLHHRDLRRESCKRVHFWLKYQVPKRNIRLQKHQIKKSASRNKPKHSQKRESLDSRISRILKEENVFKISSPKESRINWQAISMPLEKTYEILQDPDDMQIKDMSISPLSEGEKLEVFTPSYSQFQENAPYTAPFFTTAQALFYPPVFASAVTDTNFNTSLSVYPEPYTFLPPPAVGHFQSTIYQLPTHHYNHTLYPTHQYHHIYPITNIAELVKRPPPGYPEVASAPHQMKEPHAQIINAGYPAVPSVEHEMKEPHAQIINASYPAVPSVEHEMKGPHAQIINASYPAVPSVEHEMKGPHAQIINASYPAVPSVEHDMKEPHAQIINASYPAVPSVEHEMKEAHAQIINASYPVVPSVEHEIKGPHAQIINAVFKKTYVELFDVLKKDIKNKIIADTMNKFEQWWDDAHPQPPHQ